MESSMHAIFRFFLFLFYYNDIFFGAKQSHKPAFVPTNPLSLPPNHQSIFSLFSCLFENFLPNFLSFFLSFFLYSQVNLSQYILPHFLYLRSEMILNNMHWDLINIG